MNNRRKLQIWEKFKKMTFLWYTWMKWKSRCWNWKCECWIEKEFKNSDITSWLRMWCGSCRTFNRKPEWVALLNAFVWKMLSAIKKRNIDIWISKEEMKWIVILPCTYCWILWSNVIRNNECIWKEAFFNWIDRIDSNIWYVSWNCVPCCKWCNWWKNSMSKEEYIQHINLVYNYNKDV